jgi:hypothetical protein
VSARLVAEINEERRRLRASTDHAVPYAPVPAVAYKLAAIIPMSSELYEQAASPGDLWRAYWRRREFNQLRHANPFPRISLWGRRGR